MWSLTPPTTKTVLTKKTHYIVSRPFQYLCFTRKFDHLNIYVYKKTCSYLHSHNQIPQKTSKYHNDVW